MTRVAVVLSGNRVAPRAERCECVRIAHVDGDGVRVVATVTALDALVAGATLSLRDVGVDTLVCGAIGEEFAARLRAAGIEVVANCWGEAEQVLQAFGGGGAAWTPTVNAGAPRP